MPNRTRKNSVAELLAKVPVQRGSLIEGIQLLLKTIDTSESAVMIPTLLRDKCQFDAWELLFVAKILRASILGHIDLVEFYMNHIGSSMSQYTAPAESAAPLPPLPVVVSCPSLSAGAGSPSLLSSSSASSSASSSSSSSASLDTSSLSSNRWSSSGSSPGAADKELPEGELHLKESLAANGKTPGRLVQPPTLLNLTTNNNHINSLAINGAGCLDTCAHIACSQPLSIATAPATATAAANQAELEEPAKHLTAAAELQHLSINRSLASSTTSNFLAALRPSSGASSPRASTGHTPAGTPMGGPRAETLAPATGSASQLPGDPSAPVKLLLQIEQLKCSIVNVTSLLESVVELYKNSIDNLA